MNNHTGPLSRNNLQNVPLTNRMVLKACAFSSTPFMASLTSPGQGRHCWVLDSPGFFCHFQKLKGNFKYLNINGHLQINLDLQMSLRIKYSQYKSQV